VTRVQSSLLIYIEVSEVDSILQTVHSALGISVVRLTFMELLEYEISSTHGR